MSICVVYNAIGRPSLHRDETGIIRLVILLYFRVNCCGDIFTACGSKLNLRNDTFCGLYRIRAAAEQGRRAARSAIASTIVSGIVFKSSVAQIFL